MGAAPGRRPRAVRAADVRAPADHGGVVLLRAGAPRAARVPEAGARRQRRDAGGHRVQRARAGGRATQLRVLAQHRRSPRAAVVRQRRHASARHPRPAGQPGPGVHRAEDPGHQPGAGRGAHAKREGRCPSPAPNIFASRRTTACCSSPAPSSMPCRPSSLRAPSRTRSLPGSSRGAARTRRPCSSFVAQPIAARAPPRRSRQTRPKPRIGSRSHGCGAASPARSAWPS